MPLLTSAIPPLFTAVPYVVSFIVISLFAICARLIHILPYFTRRSPYKPPSRSTSHIAIVLGSGGHTAEMLSMIRHLDPGRYTQRTYIISSGDAFSAEKAKEFEAQLHDFKTDTGKSKYTILTVPRARKIHQSLYTTPFSSLVCLYACIQALLPEYEKGTPSPDLVLTNGPATGVTVIIAALIVRFLGLEGEAQMRSVYIESWARVKTLSLSGKILNCGLVDRFLVQWKELRSPGREYLGVMVE